jgi:hypothetical protein
MQRISRIGADEPIDGAKIKRSGPIGAQFNLRIH